MSELEPTTPTEPLPQTVDATPVAPAQPTTPAVPAGWHPHPTNPGLLRYWDGAAWTDHTAPAQQPPQAAPVAAPPMPQVIVQTSVGGGYVHTSHLLHFILTVLTAGLWLPVWIIVAIRNNAKRKGGGNFVGQIR